MSIVTKIKKPEFLLAILWICLFTASRLNGFDISYYTNKFRNVKSSIWHLPVANSSFNLSYCCRVVEAKDGVSLKAMIFQINLLRRVVICENFSYAVNRNPAGAR